MISSHSPSPPQGRSWDELKASAIAAIRAEIDQLIREPPGELVSSAAAPVPPAGDDLRVRAQVKDMRKRAYYVVDSSLQGGGTVADRHRVDLRSAARRGDLRFALDSTTRDALAGTHAVRVYSVTGLEIELAHDLLNAFIFNSSRGPLVEALWTPRVGANGSPPSPYGASLNARQKQALGALTSPGATFVWGPPGTGKTKVITAAVRCAVAQGQSVLITSHTHVAVDNVIEGLTTAEDDLAATPGVIVRLGSPENMTD